MARKKRKAEEDNPLRWLATYGDVVTLMLAFFVMLYAISQVDVQKFQLFVSGLADPFGNPAVKNSVLDGGDGIVGSASLEIQSEDAGDVEGPGILDGLPDVERGTGAEGEDRTLTTPAELEAVQEAIESALAAAALDQAVDYRVDSRGLVVAVATDAVLFASGSSAFGPQGEQIIDAIAPALSEFNNEVLIEGHTDDVPLRSHGYDNWNLSADRALAVLKRLTGPHGLAPERLAATGYGEHRPREANDNDEGRTANRRVELVVVLDQGETDG